MSSAVLVHEEVRPDPPAPRRKRGLPRARPWWIRLHRWVAIAVGVLLLLEVTSGTVLLMRSEIDRQVHASRFHSTASPQPLDAVAAIALVNRQHADLKMNSAEGFRGVWEVTGDSAKTAFVDPGNGHINALVNPNDGFMGFMVQIHDCFFSCEGTPGYWSFTTNTIPLPGNDFTVSSYLLGILALSLAFLAISGLITWWPALKRWGTAFRVRTKRGAYARDLDLHKLVGILAMPLLLMWGISGMIYEGFQWPGKVYYALTPGRAPASTSPQVGTGPTITPATAQAEALEQVPGGHVISFRDYGASDPGGTYLVVISKRLDYHRTISHDGPSNYVSVDGHGGGAVPEAHLSATQKFWEKDLDSLHAGNFFPWIPRLLIEVPSGLAVVLLAYTGITVWLTKWRSRRGRRTRKRRSVRISPSADA